jgi:hypothetical protein
MGAENEGAPYTERDSHHGETRNALPSSSSYAQTQRTCTTCGSKEDVGGIAPKLLREGPAPCDENGCTAKTFASARKIVRSWSDGSNLRTVSWDSREGMSTNMMLRPGRRLGL